MGTVFRKQTTRAVPVGAEFITRQGVRLARWKVKGKTRTAPITTGQDGGDRIVTESPFYVAKYRDGQGVVRVVPTGCRDETAARRVLADLERKSELVRAGVMTPDEANAGRHRQAPIRDHLDAYDRHLIAKGAGVVHRGDVGRSLARLVRDIGISTLSELTRDALERWLADNPLLRSGAPMSARSKNAHVTALVAFCNYCVSSGRLTTNPIHRFPKLDERADPRRKRRAMTEDELTRLLDAARRRPLHRRLRISKGQRKEQLGAQLTGKTRDRLTLVGEERVLIYKTLVLTGLRKGELASLTVAHLRLDDATPCVTLDAADEKNGEGNSIPLRADLVEDLRRWLSGKLDRLRKMASANLQPVPARLPPDTLVFDVPPQLFRILNRDLAFAGIPKRDERGRTLDVHALRHTFGTLLSRGGVSPRTAQAAMRHSDIKLTMNVYTDPKLLDVKGALDALPKLPLDGPEHDEATGTAGAVSGSVPQSVALIVAPTPDNERQTESMTVLPFTTNRQNTLDATRNTDKGRGSLSTSDSEPPSGRCVTRTRDILLVRPADAEGKPFAQQQVTSSPTSGCTGGCTSEGGDSKIDPVGRLAEQLQALAPEELGRPLALLGERHEFRT